jgi:hypothetical protein
MIEWPGRCNYCKETIDNWPEAGLYEGRWLHKGCYTERFSEANHKGIELEDLRSPTERGTQLEVPMLLSLLLFHFGLGFAVIGWIMINQDQSPHLGVIFMVIGVLVPLIGLTGVAVNIISRRRIHFIERQLDLAGGWRPGR